MRRWQLFREEALRSGDGRQLLLGRPPVGCEVHWIRQEVLQTLKEPLPGVGGALSSPVSALSPAAGASEASEGSAAAAVALVEQLQREQQQEGAAAAVGQVGEEQLPRRAVSAAMSVHSQSQYYDAPEAPEEEPGRRQQLAGGADLPPAGSAAGSSTPALAAAALARGAHHRRAVSGESATSTDTPPTEDSAGQGRQPVSRRFWRRFNRDMGEWDTFWDKGEQGVDRVCVPASRHIAAASGHIEPLRQSQTLPAAVHIQVVLLLTSLPARLPACLPARLCSHVCCPACSGR